MGYTKRRQAVEQISVEAAGYGGGTQQLGWQAYLVRTLDESILEGQRQEVGGQTGSAAQWCAAEAQSRPVLSVDSAS